MTTGILAMISVIKGVFLSAATKYSSMLGNMIMYLSTSCMPGKGLMFYFSLSRVNFEA